MPELPEVETIRRGLAEQIRGAVIDDVTANGCRVFQASAETLLSQLPGQRIEKLTRRGKFLLFGLQRHCLVFHLGMTGQLTVRDPERADSSRFIRHPTTGLQRARQHPPDVHTHLLLHLSDGRAVLYRDPRKFGRIELIEPGALDAYFRKLGLEPFSEEWRLEAFLKRFRNRKLRVKTLLLDQKFVAGVGNIYADEALFESGIHPARLAHRLRRWEKVELFRAVGQVLDQGIRFGGSSIRDYINSDGERGSNQEELKVYGREGQSCLVCGAAVRKIVISQRGTHFCPHCQPRSGPRKRT